MKKLALSALLVALPVASALATKHHHTDYTYQIKNTAQKVLFVAVSGQNLEGTLTSICGNPAQAGKAYQIAAVGTPCNITIHSDDTRHAGFTVCVMEGGQAKSGNASGNLCGASSLQFSPVASATVHWDKNENIDANSVQSHTDSSVNVTVGNNGSVATMQISGN